MTTTPDGVTSPDLPEVNISELFDRDPLSLNDKDLEAIVAWFRQQRVEYLQGEVQAGNRKKAAKKPAASAEDVAAANDLLGDLGL